MENTPSAYYDRVSPPDSALRRGIEEIRLQKWQIILLSVVAAVGVVFLCLAATTSNPGSFSFIVLLSAGTLFTLFSLVGLILVAIQSCCKKKHPIIIRFREVRKRLESTPLHDSARKDDIQTFRLRLEENPEDIHVKTEEGGNTPLHLAALYGKGDNVEELINQGSPIESRNKEERTALHDAAFGGNPKSVEALLKQGASVAARDENGETPLHKCAGSMAATLTNSITIMTLLDEYGADVNAQDNFGQTALHKVVLLRQQTHFPLIEILSRLGADRNIEDGSGKTAYAYSAGFFKQYMEDPLSLVELRPFIKAIEQFEKYSAEE